eukprot:COSAG02_NODE_9815_length_2101_cov_5.293207_4_plen_96_part_00
MCTEERRAELSLFVICALLLLQKRRRRRRRRRLHRHRAPSGLHPRKGSIPGPARPCAAHPDAKITTIYETVRGDARSLHNAAIRTLCTASNSLVE